MPTFALPNLLYGLLLVVPALVLIYLLRQRARRYEVSSLIFWLSEREVRESGRRLERWQSSPLFWLELFALIALLLAAATPLWRTSAASQPLVVVLDDSFSMQAGLGESAQSRARQAIARELQDHQYAPLRFVLAGAQPQLLGEATTTPDSVNKLLAQWKCGAAEADLPAALAFAFELGGERARVLVATDHAPVEPLTDSRVQWWAFGRAEANLAFVNAVRSTHGNEDVILLEIANLSERSQISNFRLEISDSRPTEALSFQPGEIKRLTYRLPAAAQPAQASLGEDALALDNAVTLLPERERPLRVAVRVHDASLRALIEQALQATEAVTISEEGASLLVTDSAITAAAGVWMLQLHAEANATSFLGPFVIDRAHPLAEGLSLGGVVWAANASVSLPGRPLITAGNVTLVSEVVAGDDARVVHLRLTPGLSTLQQSPNWPVLIWNLCRWRTELSPGLRANNVRLGGVAELLTPRQTQFITMTDPADQTKQFPVTERSLKVTAASIGVHQLEAGGATYRFAANALRQEESNLARAVSGRWGMWAQSSFFSWEFRSVSWVLLLLTLVALLVHSAEVYKGGN